MFGSSVSLTGGEIPLFFFYHMSQTYLIHLIILLDFTPCMQFQMKPCLRLGPKTSAFQWRYTKMLVVCGKNKGT
jgi:hypothetical protein